MRRIRIILTTVACLFSIASVVAQHTFLPTTRYYLGTTVQDCSYEISGPICDDPGGVICQVYRAIDFEGTIGVIQRDWYVSKRVDNGDCVATQRY